MSLKVDTDLISAAALASLANFKIWEKACHAHSLLTAKRLRYERSVSLAASHPYMESLTRHRTFLFLNEKGAHAAGAASGHGFSMYRVGDVSTEGTIKSFVSVGERANPKNFVVTEQIGKGLYERAYIVSGSVTRFGKVKSIHDLALLHSQGLPRVSGGSRSEINDTLKIIARELDDPLDAQQFVRASFQKVEQQGRHYKTLLENVESKLVSQPFIRTLEASILSRSLFWRLGKNSRLINLALAVCIMAPQALSVFNKLRDNPDRPGIRSKILFKASTGLAASFLGAETASRFFARFGWKAALLGGIAGAIGGQKLPAFALEEINPKLP